ncbi:helix-turn-helix domain-containing protein, partial [Alistipes onderdonkii]
SPGNGPQSIYKFTSDDGLLANIFNANSGIKSSTGHIYIGCNNGINKFYPYDFTRRENSAKLSVVFPDFKLFNRSVPVDGRLLSNTIDCQRSVRLRGRKMSFSLDFIALNFSSPLRTVYRYRLENFDDKWITTGLDEGAGVQHVSYTNLPPNRYRFVVSASTGGEQFGEEAVVEILVLPPWWMARAMVVAYGVLALLAVAGGGLWLRRRIGRAHREQIASITRKNKLDLLEAKVSLFTEVANEIRTPVALIAAPVEEIAKRAGDLPGLRDDVDIIRKNCERLRTLVDQILNLKSAEEGEHAASCVPERVDVREVLRTVVAAVGDAVPRRGIAVHLGLPGEALTAEMCCDHFSKIVGQILGNAYQFAESRIDVTLEGPGGEVPGDVFRVRVRDDGAGIDRAEKARIFEPFYTSDKCVSGSGLGLGLAVAKSLATRMGAVLGVESAVGQWTEFTVTVPLGAPRPVPGTDGDSGVPAGQPAVAAVQPEVQKRLPDILLAEDNADFADFFVRHLSGSYTIHCATDGRQALDLLRSRSIAAVVSDVAMKGMDGVALCAAIRNDPALDHLPVVLVSVDSSSAAKVRALEAGADAYLEKPLSVDYLDCQIRALIGIRGRLRLKFSKMPYLVMDGDAASPSGNRFMAQVNQYVMDNISNSNLSVEDIAAAVNVSRTLFFSRIKSLTGTTPNEFLRSTRLRVAAELLSKSNDLRVTEICYMVGFTSTSYFAKCFHAQFGMLPTEFMEKYRRE